MPPIRECAAIATRCFVLPRLLVLSSLRAKRSIPEFRSPQKILEGRTQCRQKKASNQFVGVIGRQKRIFLARAGRETPALKQATSFG
jgi:hypothetical protein